jgi:hypothetical protein
MARDFEDHCWKDIVDEEVIEIYEAYRREVRVPPSKVQVALLSRSPDKYKAWVRPFPVRTKAATALLFGAGDAKNQR